MVSNRKRKKKNENPNILVKDSSLWANKEILLNQKLWEVTVYILYVGG
jgi:hypothetical protein